MLRGPWKLPWCALLLLTVLAPEIASGASSRKLSLRRPFTDGKEGGGDEFSGLADVLKSKGPQALTDMLKAMSKKDESLARVVKKDADGNDVYDFRTSAQIPMLAPTAQPVTTNAVAATKPMLKASGEATVTAANAQATTASSVDAAMSNLKDSGMGDIAAQAARAAQANTMRVSPQAMANTQQVFPLQAVPSQAVPSQAVPPQASVMAMPGQPLVVSPLLSVPNAGNFPVYPAPSSQLAGIMNGLATMRRSMETMMSGAGSMLRAQPQGGAMFPAAPTAHIPLVPPLAVSEKSAAQKARMANLVARLDRAEQEQAQLNEALVNEHDAQLRDEQWLRADLGGPADSHERLLSRVEELEKRLNNFTLNLNVTDLVPEPDQEDGLSLAQKKVTPPTSRKGQGLGLRTFFHKKGAGPER